MEIFSLDSFGKHSTFQLINQQETRLQGKSAQIITMLQRLKTTPTSTLNKVFNQLNISIDQICTWQKLTSKKDQKICSIHNKLKSIIQYLKQQQRKYQIKKPKKLLRRLEIASLQNCSIISSSEYKYSERSMDKCKQNKNMMNKSISKAVEQELKYRQYYDNEQISKFNKYLQVQCLKGQKSFRASKENEKVSKRYNQIKEKNRQFIENYFSSLSSNKDTPQKLAKNHKIQSYQSKYIQKPSLQKNYIKDTHKQSFKKKKQKSIVTFNQISIYSKTQKSSRLISEKNKDKYNNSLKKLINKQKHREQIIQRKLKQQKLQFQSTIKHVIAKENKINNLSKRKINTHKIDQQRHSFNRKKYQDKQQIQEKKRQALQQQINNAYAQSKTKRQQLYKLKRRTFNPQINTNIQPYHSQLYNTFSNNSSLLFHLQPHHHKDKLDKIQEQSIKRRIQNKSNEQFLDKQIINLRAYSTEELRFLYQNLINTKN